MAEKRKDNKGRVLKEGECQKKNGSYQFKKLNPNTHQYDYVTDPTLEGMRRKKAELLRAIESGISYSSGKITVNELLGMYIEMKDDKTENTQINYASWAEMVKRESFGNRRICDVKEMEVRRWFKAMRKNGKAYNTISAMSKILKPSFKMAMKNHLIRENPFDFRLNDVLTNDTVKREALTDEQVAALLDFIAHDNTYSQHLDWFIVLLETGVRISEFCGLTKADLDFENRLIVINKQLLRRKDGSKYVKAPKSAAGNRVIAMSDEASNSLHNILEHRKCRTVEPMIDGYCGFLMLTKGDKPVVATGLGAIMRRVVEKYNREHSDNPLPPITPHIFRHTLCSSLLNEGMSAANVAAIMGHDNPTTTMKYYAHANNMQAIKQMRQILEFGRLKTLAVNE